MLSFENFPSSPERQIKIDEIFQELKEAEIESILLASQIINFGNHGIIFKIEWPPVDSEFDENSQEKAIRAVKLLKLYQPGKGEREFRNQMFAYKLIADQVGKEDDFVKIPRPIDFCSIEISPSTREYLNKHGAFLFENKVEMILMDFIPGEDLARILCKWIIKNHPDTERKVVLCDENNINELFSAVSKLLGFARPKIRSLEGFSADEKRIYNQNSDRLYDFLKKNGFVLHPKLLKRIENTVFLFHSHGFYHNDLHERNIMIVGDPSDPQAEVFMVDFSSAGPKIPEAGDDFSIIRNLEKLFKPEPNPSDVFHAELIKTILTRQKESNWQKKYRSFLKKLEEGENINSLLEKQYLLDRSADKDLWDFFVLVIELINKGLLEKQAAITFLETKKSFEQSEFVMRYLSFFIDFLKREAEPPEK